MRFMHSLIKSLTFEWISYGMDSEPSFWRLWAPVALKKMRFFSCMNISNQISKTWMFGLFRPYVLYPMSETLEILKIGYSRWSFADPAPGYITANNHFNRKRKSLPNDPDSLGKRRRYSDLPGDSTENVLPLLSLLKPLSEGEAEDYQLAGIDLVAKLESLTEGRDNEYVLSRSSRPAFPQLLQLELKLWHEIACINNFAPFFDVENRSFKRLQRLHLEGYNLPRHFVWGDLGRSAEAEEFPSQYGLLRDIQKDGIDGDSVGTRYPENRGSSSQTQQIKVTHDNLWEDNLAVLPGRNPQKWSQRHVIPWGSCWSWAVDPEKAYRYFDTLEARLPWVSLNDSRRSPNPSPQSSSPISLPNMSSMSNDSPNHSPVSTGSSLESRRSSSLSSSERETSQLLTGSMHATYRPPLIASPRSGPESDENVVNTGKGCMV